MADQFIDQLAEALVPRLVERLAPKIAGYLSDNEKDECQIISPNEARKMAHCSSNTVYDAVKSGELKAIRDGTRWKVRVSDVREWIQRRWELKNQEAHGG